ncbi:glycosyltransferase [uncultured Lactobacillus sp.]|uniref:glycosyltransferase n=1 Tax=uncultured Lactobacillus sp. TaxID=153152 RepID=UPI0028046146|nr:glycosyltransferase [uncultured Lactobacillus sp.]
MENKLQELNEQVSFIVPVYNKSVEQFKLCLNSIISQNKFIKEILVIDDGSKAEFGKDYATISKKMGAKYIYQNNKGVSLTRNRGIKEASGKYIAFVDADDVLQPEAIQRTDFDKNPDLVIYDVIKRSPSFSDDKLFSFPKMQIYPKTEELLKYVFSESLINWSVAKLYSRKFLLKNNLYFNSDLKQGEDLDFVVRVILSQPHLKYFSRVNYIYNFTTRTGDMRIEKDPLGSLRDAKKIYNLHMQLLKLMPSSNKEKLNELVCSEAVKELLRITTMILIKDSRFFIKNHVEFRDYAIELENKSTYSYFYKKGLKAVKNKNLMMLYFYGYSRLIYHKLAKK